MEPGKTSVDRDTGSFRDPGAFIFQRVGRVCHAVSHHSLEDWKCFSTSPLFQELQQEQLLFPTHSIDLDSLFLRHIVDASAAVVEHERVPFISYPYEWSFEMLKDAALLHLDMLERCLPYDLILKDSSACNVQFVGGEPIFIDILSFARSNLESPGSVTTSSARCCFTP